MSVLPSPRLASYAELEAAPAHLVAEIVQGSLVTHSRPAPEHAVASSALGGELNGAFRKGRGGPGGWLIRNDAERHIGTDVVGPEVPGWRRERMPTLPETAFSDVVPDWVSEVPSPSTERADRGFERIIYAQALVSHLWLLDPRAELLETFDLRDGGWSLTGTFGGTDPVSVAPFDAIPFSLGELWPFSQTAEAAAAPAPASTTTDT